MILKGKYSQPGIFVYLALIIGIGLLGWTVFALITDAPLAWIGALAILPGIFFFGGMIRRGSFEIHHDRIRLSRGGSPFLDIPFTDIGHLSLHPDYLRFTTLKSKKLHFLPALRPEHAAGWISLLYNHLPDKGWSEGMFENELRDSPDGAPFPRILIYVRRDFLLDDTVRFSDIGTLIVLENQQIYLPERSAVAPAQVQSHAGIKTHRLHQSVLSFDPPPEQMPAAEFLLGYLKSGLETPEFLSEFISRHGGSIYLPGEKEGEAFGYQTQLITEFEQ